jgi:hypothetical protein
VAAWLTAEGVQTSTGGTVWNEGYLGASMVKNPVYYGARRNGGQLETGGLVSYSTWQAANAALASRVRPGRATTAQAKALLSPVCGNPDCDATRAHPSPMYRVFTGTGSNRVAYYRCTGRGPQRHGCGNMVPLAELDESVTEAMTSDHMNMHRERVFIAGDDRSDQVGKLREQAADAYRAGDKARFMELDVRADELAALPSIAPHWEARETPMTEGQHFTFLSVPERRAELSQHWGVSVYRSTDGTVLSIVPRELAS